MKNDYLCHEILKKMQQIPQISCFLPFQNEGEGLQTIHALQADENVASVNFIENPFQTSALRQMAMEAFTPYILLYTKIAPWGDYST